MKQIETERLILRNFKESDYDDLYEFLSQRKDDDFEAYPGITYENGREHLKYRVGSDEFYAIELKESGKVIGNVYFGNRDFEAKEKGKKVATDVHVLSSIEDDYNGDFMEAADILFLSDEQLPCEIDAFVQQLADRYPAQIIVVGMGQKGAYLYERATESGELYPCVQLGKVVNTIGAGDALFSAFLHFYSMGESAKDALYAAQIFAAKKIQSNGAAIGFPTEAEVEEIRKGN